MLINVQTGLRQHSMVLEVGAACSWGWEIAPPMQQTQDTSYAVCPWGHRTALGARSCTAALQAVAATSHFQTFSSL